MSKQYPALKNFLLLPIVIMGMAASAQDLPSPRANSVTLPAGSYILAMDNTNQLGSGSLFNLKAYGLAVYLLNNQVKLKWIITSGKAKDGIDFTVSTTQLRPTLNLAATIRDFKAGPLVIFASDTAGVASLIDGFYAANSLTGNSRPNVFVSTAAVTVDQRYDLTGFRPTAAILSDGGNQAIHQAFMTAASIPASNYTVVSGLDLLSNCYTFASEPHNSKTGSTVNTVINNIHLFVASGGNFLAECAAIPNYENNTLGRFQTTTGVTVTNTSIGTGVLFPNPDLSYSQFEGVFNGSLTGSVENWQINASGNNSEHNHVTGSGANTASIAASVSKLVTGKGGLAFYLGNHNYSTSDLQNINGIRMYMNALLTPAYQVCPSLLPVGFVNVQGRFQAGKNVLTWSVSGTDKAGYFQVEKSIDGKAFFTLATIGSRNQVTSYSYEDASVLPGAYYRIRYMQRGGSFRLSSVLELSNPFQNAVSVYLSSNRTLMVSCNSGVSELLSLTVCNAQGQLVFTTCRPMHSGKNLIALDRSGSWPKGMYFVTLASGTFSVTKKLVF